MSIQNSTFAIVVNPVAGSGGRGSYLLDSVLACKGAVGKLVTQCDSGSPAEWPVIETDKAGLWKAQLRDLIKNTGVDSVMAIGGDGTLLDVVKVLKEFEGKSLLAVPAGRGNDFVRGLFDYDISYGDFWGWILQKMGPDGVWKKIALNLGAVNEKIFLNMASIGYGGKIVENVHNRNALWSKTSAVYQVEGALALFQEKEVECSVLSEGKKVYEGKFFGAFIGNGKSNGGGLYWTPDALVNDGLLDVIIFGKPGFLKMAQVIADVKKKKDLRIPMTRLQVKSLEFEFAELVSLELDGEFEGDATRYGINCLEQSLYTWVINS